MTCPRLGVPCEDEGTCQHKIVCAEDFKCKMQSAFYECLVSFTYNASDPLEAAKQFMQNLRSGKPWIIDVKDLDAKKHYTVNIDTGEIEEAQPDEEAEA